MWSQSRVMESIYLMGLSHFPGPACHLPLLLTVASWAESDWQFLWAVVSQNQSRDGQRARMFISWRNTLTALPPCVTSGTPGQLQQPWTWTHPSRRKQGFLQALFYLLQSAVLSVLIQSAISLTIKPDVRRHGPSMGTESMPFRNAE